MMGYGKVAAFAELGHFFIFQLRDRYDYKVYVLFSHPPLSFA